MFLNSKIWLVNGLLLLALGIGCVKIWDVWQTPSTVLAGSSPAANEKTGRAVKSTPEKRLAIDARYAEIVDQNLFSPDRAPAPPPPPESVEATPEPEEVKAEVRISGEKVELYGVVMLDEYKKALTNDPADRTVQTRWVSEGDKIGNLVVREISQDTVLLSDAEKTYRVLLYDPKKIAKSGSKTPHRSPESGSPQIVSAGSAPRQATSGSPAAKTDNVSKPAASNDQDEYETIVTPFGTIKRKKR